MLYNTLDIMLLTKKIFLREYRTLVYIRSILINNTKTAKEFNLLRGLSFFLLLYMPCVDVSIQSFMFYLMYTFEFDSKSKELSNLMICLPERIARNTPIGNMYNTFWLFHRQNRWQYLDGLLENQPRNK